MHRKINQQIVQARARNPAAKADEDPAALEENGQHRPCSALQPFRRAVDQAAWEDRLRWPLAGLHVVRGGRMCRRWGGQYVADMRGRQPQLKGKGYVPHFVPHF